MFLELRPDDHPDLRTGRRPAQSDEPTSSRQMQPQQVVKLFCEQCEWTWTVVHQYRLLFERGQLRLDLLDAVAPQYFRFLQAILIEYIYLQFSRLTDPARSGKFENLTAAYLVEQLPWSGSTRRKLEDLLRDLHAFRPYVERARSKIVAHADLSTHAVDTPLGGFPVGDEQRFLATLQEFVNVAHGEIVGGPYPLDALTPGDASDLIGCLKRGVAFQELLRREPSLCREALVSSRFHAE